MTIELLAGRKAFEEIRRDGLRPERVRLMVGASGGPKWLMLSRLDQYLSKHFFSKAKQEISLIGSSVGAWRMACYAQPDPVQAFRMFEALYTNQRYSKPVKPGDITLFVEKVLDALFRGENAERIVTNANRHLHVVAVRNRRCFQGRSKLSQSVPLLFAAMGNLLSPAFVHSIYPRVLISRGLSVPPYRKKPDTVELTAENLSQALAASGAIPLVMEPTKVKGSLDRWHWDGGMADYHFSGPFSISDGLVFYPHFSRKVIPGWFDKGLPWRRIKAKDYENVVMLVPSDEFIATLPFQKIPDRKDFETMTDQVREEYWSAVLAETDKLVDSFHDSLTKNGGRSLLRPIEQYY